MTRAQTRPRRSLGGSRRIAAYGVFARSLALPAALALLPACGSSLARPDPPRPLDPPIPRDFAECLAWYHAADSRRDTECAVQLRQDESPVQFEECLRAGGVVLTADDFTAGQSYRICTLVFQRSELVTRPAGEDVR